MTDLFDCLGDCIGILTVEDLQFLQEILLGFAQIYLTGGVPQLSSSIPVEVNWDNLRYSILSSEILHSKEYLVLTAVQFLDECVQIKDSRGHPNRLIAFCEQQGMLVFTSSWSHIIDEFYAFSQTLFMEYYHRELGPSFFSLLKQFCEENLSPEARTRVYADQDDSELWDFSEDDRNN